MLRAAVPLLRMCSILDLWMAGSGTTSVSVSILDSATNKTSTDVRLNNARQAQPVTILQVDNEGFTHMQINLTAFSAASHTVLNAPALSQLDKVQFKDVSNMGLRLVLDEIKLLPAGAAPTAASTVLQPSMVPLLADDQDELKSAQNRYIMKLRPVVTPEDVARICQELAGNVSEPRFKGGCHTVLPEVSC